MKLMASIIKKKIKGQTYYYAAESKRVDGKPRIVWQKYLGKVSDIVEAVCSADNMPEPATARVYSFGAEAALLGLARRAGVAEIINKHTRLTGGGLDVGEYILIHAINCCTEPGVKISNWYSSTVLRRHLSVNPRTITEKRSREVADLLNEDVINKIQLELAASICAEFGLGSRSLIYNDFKLPGAATGKGRGGGQPSQTIALLVSSDFFIPLFYQVYRNDVHDPAEAKEYTDRLAESCGALGRPEQDITIVKHQCLSPEEIGLGPFDHSCRLLGMLPKNGYEELLGIPLDRYHPLKNDRRKKVKVYRTSLTLSGEDTAALVVFSEKDMQKELNHVRSALRRSLKELQELKTYLQLHRSTGDTENTVLSFVEKRVGEILSKPFLKSLVNVSFSFDETGRFDLDFDVREDTLTPAEEKNLGKSIIFTNNINWDNEEIYSAFYGRAELEEAVASMSRRSPGVAVQPPKEEASRRAAVFYTILGLTLQTLLRRELYRYGVKSGLPEILKLLSGIQEVAVLYSRDERRTKKKEYLTLTQMNQKQKQIYEYLRLKQYEAGG